MMKKYANDALKNEDNAEQNMDNYMEKKTAQY